MGYGPKSSTMTTTPRRSEPRGRSSARYRAFVMAVGAISWMHHMYSAGLDGVRRSASVGVLYTMVGLVGAT